MSDDGTRRGQSVPTGRLTLAVDPHRDHIQGELRAPLTLVEYGDFQCPYCGAAYPIVKKIQAEFGSSLRLVFRNFPLTQMHPQAEFAAELAEATVSRGKYWEVHDFIYEHQASLGTPEPFVRQVEKAIPIDPANLGAEIDAHSHLSRIREDFMSGVRSGVNGTPTFYINGFRHDRSYDFTTLSRALREALANSR